MDTTTILARIADLKQQRETAISNVNALSGAIQDCEFWLGRVVNADEAAKAAEKDVHAEAAEKKGA